MHTGKINFSTQQVLFIAVILAVAVVVGFWIFQLSKVVTSNVEQTREQNIYLTGVAQQMRVDVIQVQQWLTDISATRGLDGLNDGFDEAEKSYRSFLEGLGIFRRSYSSSGDAGGLSQLETLRTNIDAYYKMGKTMAQGYIDGGPATGNQLMADFDQAAEAIYGSLEPFIEKQGNNTAVAMDNIIGSVERLRTGISVIFFVAIVVLIIGAFVQSRSSSKRMERILETLQASASGNLDLQMDDSGKGEMVKVAAAFNSLIAKLAQVITDVKRSTGAITSGSEQISAGNTNLSQRTEEQASSLEETASSMEEMTSTVKQNADNADQASQLAQTARDRAEAGGQVVSKAVTAMGEINQSSSKIADIISVVEEIAFQTNLLALNAAVEAARAGEQGRGFAVVASEVRVLAGRSADAAKEIKSLIEDSVDKVKAGSDLVDKSGETLEEIVTGVKKVTDIVFEIAAASREQSSGIDQVNKAIAQMDDMTQQNASLVEEASAASLSMSGQAQKLNEVVSFFKLDGRNYSTSKSTAIDHVPHTDNTVKPAVMSQPRIQKQVTSGTTAKGDDGSWEDF